MVEGTVYSGGDSGQWKGLHIVVWKAGGLLLKGDGLKAGKRLKQSRKEVEAGQGRERNSAGSLQIMICGCRFISAGNGPSIHACMDIWRLPRGSFIKHRGTAILRPSGRIPYLPGRHRGLSGKARRIPPGCSAAG